MRIVIESTEEIVVMDGVPTRAWQGVTDDGVRCLVMVHRIVIPTGEPTASFERELHRHDQPTDLEFFAPLDASEQRGPFPEWN